MRTSLRPHFTALCVLISTLALTQQPLRCNEQRVTYSPEDQRFTGKIEVTSIPPTTPGNGKEEKSIEKTRYFVLQEPDFMKNGPWTTVVWIGDATKKATLRLEFRDHGNGGVHLQWLNENLLYGSVWWGRMVATDFIFNVATKKFIYREMAHYGQMAPPCQP